MGEQDVRPPRGKMLAWNGLIGLLALLMLAVGVTKLAGQQMHVDNFARWGYAPWFMYAVGAWETTGGVLLFVSRLRPYAAAFLFLNFAGATITHIRVGEWALLSGPVILGLLFAWIFWRERPARFFARSDDGPRAG